MTYRVEITVTRDDGTTWTDLPLYGHFRGLAGITRDEAVDRASKLPRCGGKYAYRVRPDR